VKQFVFLAVAGLLTAGCRSDQVAGPSNANAATSVGAILASRDGGDAGQLPPPGAPGLRVMTYNVYLGTDLGPILQSGSEQDFLVAAIRAYAELQQTNFLQRAGKIAGQIAAVRPDIVGLDEVALWSRSSPYSPGSPPSAPFVTQYDFLKLVLDSLKAHHLNYVAAVADTTSDVSAPVATAFDDQGNPTAFALVRFQDRDAILVRAGVRFRDPRHGRFAAHIPLDLLGTTSGLYRGWCSIEATVDAQTFRYVNSHLEAESPDVNLAQAHEMVGLLQKESDPVVWAGDFNADANAGAATYRLVTGSGFTDLWPLAHPRDLGLTNGPADGVGALNAEGVLVPYPSLVFDARIDLVLLRDRNGRLHDVRAATFGTERSDRTASGLFPSDHAAVGMVFELPKTWGR
jgi:endonuclease/exonuclease/phosphatase family metal-dependent hydrolase